MFDSSSYVNPTPLAHADTSRDVLPRGDVSAKYYHGLPTAESSIVEAFPAIQNKKELETRFYASQQRQNQEPTDFVYDLLKTHKMLELRMSEKALVGHIFVKLKPQVQDYVEVRNPQTTIQLLEVLAKFKERYSCKATLGSRNINNVEGRGRNECRMSNVDNNRGNWRNSEVVHIDQVIVEIIIEVAIRTTVKEISGSRAGIGFKTMIANLTTGDINLEIEVKMTILVEGTKEIGVRVKILVDAVDNKWDV
ncbi:uncharacterized protein TNCV_3424991 [Trichonephila clavipes]|nr:uncharacterized protein TNCV_3424991 [Trichonephila clavipes]